MIIKIKLSKKMKKQNKKYERLIKKYNISNKGQGDVIDMFVASDFIKKNIIIRDIDNKELEIINNKYDE